MNRLRTLSALVAIALVGGCATSTAQTRYEDPDAPAKGATGVGIESQDIRAMTDKMARDILSSPHIARLEDPPYVIIDDKYFTNEGSTPINKRMITERLMVELNRAASGRMYFVERQAESMVEAERQRKREGEVAEGSLDRSSKIAGADYRLTGRIMTQDAIQADEGEKTRYHQIVFKLINLENSLAVWTGMYEFKKSSTADILYR